MSKAIRQFRYYDEGHSKNYPLGVTSNSFQSGDIFFNEERLISIGQLGIQTLPGVRFYLNDPNKSHPMVIGMTGIYELDLEGQAEIISLSFDEDSLTLIKEASGGYLIVDAIYEVEEE